VYSVVERLACSGPVTINGNWKTAAAGAFPLTIKEDNAVIWSGEIVGEQTVTLEANPSAYVEFIVAPAGGGGLLDRRITVA
jgi:hypothetical protein